MFDVLYDYFLSVPVLFKVMGTLFLLLLLNAWWKKMSLAIVAGILLLAFWSGHSPEGALGIVWERFSSLSNLCLLLIVFQVIWLSDLMQRTGFMSALVLSVRQRVTHRTAIAALPAIIGMLPMPGGAVFSAPLVDDCDAEDKIEPLQKTLINYWFRHVWEYWWPLYPGVILAIEISGVEIWQFILVQLPMSLLAILIGAWFLLGKIHPPEPSFSEESYEEEAKSPLLSLLAPIISVVAVYLFVRLFFPQLAEITRYAPMIAGLCGGLGVLQIQRPLGWGEWRNVLLNRRTVVLALLVALVRIYGAFIEAELPDGNLLIEQMRVEMTAWGLPFILVIMAIPFLSGMATGLAVGFIGASFPIVFSLLPADAQLLDVLSTIVLAFGFGYMGMILSPVHICLIVSNEHFRTRLVHSLRGLVLPALTMLICVGVVYLLMSLF